MPSPSPDETLEALGEVVRTRLVDGNEAVLPGVGKLSVVHQRSQQFTDDEGEPILLPPRDVIAFTSEP